MSQGIASKAIASNPPPPPEIDSLFEVYDVPATEQSAPKGRDNAPAVDKKHPVTTSAGAALARQQSATDARTLASVDRLSTEPDAVIPTPSKTYHPFSPAVVALLMPASIFGTLARLGLEGLATYNGKAIFPLAYPQAMGCLIMGIALPLKDTISIYYGPLYTAITTGFCGSLTTFSGWQLDVFYSWINEGEFHRGWLRDAVDGVSKLFFTLLISLASLSFGIHIGTALLPLIPKMQTPSASVRYMISVVSFMSYLATFPTYFLLSASFRHQATASLLFSFPGTFTRYVFSILLNPRSKLLPVGTLTANVLGTALLASFHVLLGLRPAVSPGACGILQGLGDGYCGCLTTVSTFAAELNALVGRKRWLYGTISIVMGQVVIVLILGSTLWTGTASAQTSCRAVM